MPTLKAKIDGVWVKVSGAGGSGGGTDEVWVGPDDPIAANPTIELWVDSDAANLADPNVARWNSAWGVIGQARNAAPFQTTAPHMTMQSTGLSVSVNETAGRRLKITHQSSPYPGGGDQAMAYRLFRNGVLVDQWYIPRDALDPVTSFPMAHVAPFDAIGGAATWVIHMMAVDVETTVNEFAAEVAPRVLMIEDVGPVSRASNPPAQPASVWTPLPFAGTWGNYDPAGSYELCHYRMVGDVVQLRGLAKSTGTDMVIGMLPPGFRPPRPVLFAVFVASSTVNIAGRLDVFGDGSVRAQTHAAGVGPYTYYGINCQFSVTP